MDDIQSKKNIAALYKKFIEFENVKNSKSELLDMLKIEEQEKVELLKLAQSLYFGNNKPQIIDSKNFENINDSEIYYISTDKNKIKQILFEDTFPNNFSDISGIFCTNLTGYAENLSKEFGIDGKEIRFKLDNCHFCDVQTISYLADHLFIRTQQNREIKSDTEFDFNLNQIRNYLVSHSDLESKRSDGMAFEFLTFLKNNPSILAVMLKIDCITKDDIFETQSKTETHDDLRYEKFPFTWFAILNREKLIANENEISNLSNNQKNSNNEINEQLFE